MKLKMKLKKKVNGCLTVNVFLLQLDGTYNEESPCQPGPLHHQLATWLARNLPGLFIP